MFLIYLSSVKLFSFLIKYHILIYFIFLGFIFLSIRYIPTIVLFNSPLILLFWNKSIFKLNSFIIFLY